LLATTTSSESTLALRPWQAISTTSFFEDLLDSGGDSLDGAETPVELNVFVYSSNPIETILNDGLQVFSQQLPRKSLTLNACFFPSSNQKNIFRNTTLGTVAVENLTSIPYYWVYVFLTSRLGLLR
jgi:hypothetical protein